TLLRKLASVADPATQDGRRRLRRDGEDRLSMCAMYGMRLSGRALDRAGSDGSLAVLPAPEPAAHRNMSKAVTLDLPGMLAAGGRKEVLRGTGIRQGFSRIFQRRGYSGVGCASLGPDRVMRKIGGRAARLRRAFIRKRVRHAVI
ncbi:MAG: hypothetical protein AAF982_03325, partial [Pseudomonadota bacterium]